MRRAGLSIVLILLAALAAWLGPRPVYEPWTLEAIGAERARNLELATVLEQAVWDRERLAERLRVPASSLLEALAGGVPLDADRDGDEDAFAWGAPTAEGGSRLIFLLQDGGLRDVARQLGPAFREPQAVAAAAAADLDRDGRPDIALRLVDGAFVVLWNRLEPRRSSSGDQ